MNEVCAAVEGILEEAFMFCEIERRIPAITHRINTIIDTKIEEYFFAETRLDQMLEDHLQNEVVEITQAASDSVKTWTDYILPDLVEEFLNQSIKQLLPELKKDINLSRLVFLEAVYHVKSRGYDEKRHQCPMHEEIKQLRDRVAKLEKQLEKHL